MLAVGEALHHKLNGAPYQLIVSDIIFFYLKLVTPECMVMTL